jgi:hypothetical protein
LLFNEKTSYSIFFKTKINKNYQSLVGSVVIDAELGMIDHDSIPAIAIGRRLEPLNARLNWW